MSQHASQTNSNNRNPSKYLVTNIIIKGIIARNSILPMKPRLARHLQNTRSRIKTNKILVTEKKMNAVFDQESIKKKPKYDGVGFAQYALEIIENPIYSGMPDLYGNKGKIQWEAPSNRSGGKFKNTHHLRRDWWRAKAALIGINPSLEKAWISKVAKAIHPLGKKPCKSCGTWMWLGYCYIAKGLLVRIDKLGYVPANIEINSITDIRDLIPLLAAATNNRILDDLPNLLATKSGKIPSLGKDLTAWMKFINEIYIPSEPSLLSPGAMSNAPDRLDGFHSFNRCCRSSADTGRSKTNLASYVTDRRVFEYWVDGDWIAADRLMGQVRSNKNLHKENCFNFAQPGSHPLPCQADHIGPISIGFTHRPQFQFLCRTCNSSKNNRMYATDITILLNAELNGETVISWYAVSLWDKLKHLAIDDESALRLSKILRDNRHAYMAILNGIYTGGHFSYLASLLNLSAADRDCKFINLRAHSHTTLFDSMEEKLRDTKYVTQQKARRISVGFSSLRDYLKKDNRNSYVTDQTTVDQTVSTCGIILEKNSKVLDILNLTLGSALLLDKDSDLMRLATIQIDEFCRTKSIEFKAVTDCIKITMDEIAQILSLRWNDERYRRVEMAFSALVP